MPDALIELTPKGMKDLDGSILVDISGVGVHYRAVGGVWVIQV